MGRPVAQVMHWKGAEWLLRATRESEEHTSRLLEALAVKPGDRVCDFGCGVGYLSLPLAERVGEAGEVVAVDIQPEMLVQLEERARQAGAKRIRTVLGDVADPKLEPGSCDLVLMVDVYHELSYPEQILAAVKRALAPGGRLVLVEFRAEDAAIPIKPEHKMSSAQVERELAANGWRLASSFDDLPWQHVLTFQPAEALVEESGSAGFFDAFGVETRDGSWLYQRHCAGCHGVSGAGDGETAKALGASPRDFVKGGFSFGNTRESLFRTISSGIPGRSVMPSFAGTLSEDERWLVVDHVRSLMPPQSEADARASVLEVHDRPVVARGKLPPLAEGRPEHPRGLLIGLPSGLTFEYDLDDVRLLAVRMGPFADREDWRDRGGGFLRPLGQPIQRLEWGGDWAGDPWKGWKGYDVFYGVAPRLQSTSIRDGRVALEYALTFGDHIVADVTEDVGTASTANGPAFSRRFSVQCARGRALFAFPLGSRSWDMCRPLESAPGWRAFLAVEQSLETVLVAIRGDVEIENLGWKWKVGMMSQPHVEDTDSSGPLLVGVSVLEGRNKDWEILTLPVSSAESDDRLAALVKELTR
jgi:ubiquinone/menaquinone biosynthesis C-methylase UbiE